MKHFSQLVMAVTFAIGGCFNVANAKSVSRLVNTKDFSGISVGSVIDVELSQGARRVEVVTSPEFQNAVIVEVKNSVLTLGVKPDTDFKNEEIVVRVSNPTYNFIKGIGASEIDVKGKLDVNNLMIDLSGACDMDFNTITATDVDIKGTGASGLSGKFLNCGSLIVSLTGATEFDVDKVHTVSLKLESTGAAEASSENLSLSTLVINASGAGEIDFDNIDAADITVDVSGAAEVTLGGKAGKVDLKASGACDVDICDMKCDNINTRTSGVADIKQ